MGNPVSAPPPSSATPLPYSPPRSPIQTPQKLTHPFPPGANTGLGLLTARLLSLSPPSSSYHIILTSRHLSSAESAISTLPTTTTVTFSALELDVTDPRAVDAAVEYVERDFGYLSVLVNNAGVSPKTGGLREDAETAMGTNFVGSVGVGQACLPLLRKGVGKGGICKYRFCPTCSSRGFSNTPLPPSNKSPLILPP